MEWRLVLADVIAVVHLAFVAFVVLGLVVVWVGWLLKWRWVRNPWFRLAHLLAMAQVTAQALLGIVCPLTTWENDLRRAAGREAAYEETFMQHWVHRIMFFEAELWVFTVCYVAFFVALVASWVFVRPRGFRANKGA